MAAEWEFIDVGTFPTEVEYTDLASVINKWDTQLLVISNLWVRNTTVIPRFGVWLVLAVTVATSWTTTHCLVFWRISSAGQHLGLPKGSRQRNVIQTPSTRSTHPKPDFQPNPTSCYDLHSQIQESGKRTHIVSVFLRGTERETRSLIKAPTQRYQSANFLVGSVSRVSVSDRLPSGKRQAGSDSTGTSTSFDSLLLFTRQVYWSRP